MTICQYGAILLGALVISLGLSFVPAQAEVDPMDRDIHLIEPDLTGFHEIDDIPSYLALDRPVADDEEFAVAPPLVNLAYADRSVLAPDGPGGLRWSVLARLGLFAILCFAVVFYGGRSNA